MIQGLSLIYSVVKSLTDSLKPVTDDGHPLRIRTMYVRLVSEMKEECVTACSNYNLSRISAFFILIE